MAKKKFKKSKKKNYNPFKMWESWVGTMWGIISAFFISFAGFEINIFRIIFLPQQLSSLTFETIFPTVIGFGALYHIVLSSIYGFLIGWGINSLIRKYKK